jgi:hypothetical protein
LAHVTIGGAAVALLVWLGTLFPRGAEQQRQALFENHRAALLTSVSSLDFTMVKYHANVLTVLDDGPQQQADAALERRADLLRMLVERPWLLANAAGQAKVDAKIAEVELAERVAANAGGPQSGTEGGAAQFTGDADAAQALSVAGSAQLSPDLLTARCYLAWRRARTGADQLVAVTDCIAALAQDPNPGPQVDPGFVLRSVAVHYVDLLVRRPPAGLSVDVVRMQALTQKGPRPLPFLKPAVTYDDLVLALEDASSAAYLALLDAEARVQTAYAALDPKQRAEWTAPLKRGAKREPPTSDFRMALVDRDAAAHAVVAAWSTFDAGLASAPELSSATTALAAFSLNDAPLAAALFYRSQPDTIDLAPAVSRPTDARLRAAMAPLRIRWASRYLQPLGASVGRVAANEESDRYLQLEKTTLDFAQQYVELRLAQSKNDLVTAATKRDAAARAAAALGIYVSRGGKATAFGVTLLDEPATGTAATDATRKDVVRIADGVRLRLF